MPKTGYIVKGADLFELARAIRLAEYIKEDERWGVDGDNNRAHVLSNSSPESAIKEARLAGSILSKAAQHCCMIEVALKRHLPKEGKEDEI